MSDEITKTEESPIESTPIESPTEVSTTPEPEEVVTLFTAADVEAQLAARDLEWESKLSGANNDAAAMRTQLDAVLIERSLSDAITKAGAFNSEQITPLLKPYTAMENGSAVVRIEGYVMSVPESVEWLYSQTERYGNLFRSRSVPGVGGHSDPGGMRGSHRMDVRNMSAGEYRAVRAEHPGLVGLRGDQ